MILYFLGYVKAASGNKDVIILMDISGSMKYNNRLDLAKEAVISVLSTLGSESFVSVIPFNDVAHLSCFGMFFTTKCVCYYQ